MKKKVKKSTVKTPKNRKKINFKGVKKPPKTKPKKNKCKLKINLPFEEAVKSAFSKRSINFGSK